MANLMVLADKWHTFIRYDGKVYIDGNSGYTNEAGNEEFRKLNIKKVIKLDTAEKIEFAINLCKQYVDEYWMYIDDYKQCETVRKNNEFYSKNIAILAKLQEEENL